MIEIQKEQAEILWKGCLAYLSTKMNIDDALDLASDKTNPLLTEISTIYKRLLQSLSNRQGMPNSIGDVENLSIILCNFTPSEVCFKYKKKWQNLFNEIKTKVNPSSRIDDSIPQNYWLVFCKGAIDAAIFLSKFMDGYEFVDSVKRFAESDIFIAGLPKVLEIEIHGLGFSLACDFLKESGWSQYAKADVHTKKILSGIGLSDGTDYGTFRSIIQISKHLGESPYRIDKILWLIGSGKLYNRNKKLKTSRKEFLEYWNANFG